MADQRINRFEWLKAVTQSAELNCTAKAVATALAVQFASDETGQLNPSAATLSAYVKVSLATIKRAITDLVKSGWITRTEGRGTGNRTEYTLTSPGKIVAFRAAKGSNPNQEKASDLTTFGGSNLSLSGCSKGSNMSLHRLKSEPSYIEQSLEQKARPFDAFRNHHFRGNPFDGPTFVSTEAWSNLNGWGDWLRMNGFPQLCDLPIWTAGKKAGTRIFALPYRDAPDTPDKTAEALAYFAHVSDAHAVRHAAQ